MGGVRRQQVQLELKALTRKGVLARSPFSIPSHHVRCLFFPLFHSTWHNNRNSNH